MLTAVIEAHEGRDVMTVDVPNVLMNPMMKKPRPCMPSLQAMAITLHQQTFAMYC